MRITESRLRKIIRSEIINESVSDFLKGSIYNQYEIAIQNLIKSKKHYNIGNLYLVPASDVSDVNIKINKDELYKDNSGNHYVIILKENIPMIGLSLITNYNFIEKKNKYTESIKKIISDKNLSRI